LGVGFCAVQFNVLMNEWHRVDMKTRRSGDGGSSWQAEINEVSAEESG